MIRRRALILATILGTLSGLLAGAAADVVVPLVLDLQRAGWQELTFDDKTPNRWRGSEGRLSVESDRSVSVLYWPLRNVDLRATPILSWRWRVDEAGPPTNLDRKGQDDRPLAILVAFPYDPSRATTWERVKRAFVEWFVDRDAPGKVLVYVWGGIGARGMPLRNPYLETAGQSWILRPGISPLGQWFDEQVDIATDFRNAFGYPAPAPMYVAVSADTDDTNSRSRGTVADLRLGARPPGS